VELPSGRREEITWSNPTDCNYYDSATDMDYSGSDYDASIMPACHTETPFIWIEDGDIVIDMSQQNFTDVVQYNLKQTTQTVHVPIVLAYRNSNGDIIDGLETEFTLSVTGEDTTHPCASAEVTLRSEAKETEILSFGEYIEGETETKYKALEIRNALQTRWTDDDFEDICHVKYRMQVYNCPTQQW
jgi:hypothetical protein